MSGQLRQSGCQFGHRVSRLEPLVLARDIDCVISESEDGFCQLGQERQFLSKELGYPDTGLTGYAVEGYRSMLEPSIAQLCDWNRSENRAVTLVVMPSRRLESRLRGLILVPHDGAACYQRFASGERVRPYRDFMYNVTYEAIYQAFHRLGARRIALTHLSRVKTWLGTFKADVTKCQVEAALHFCEEHSGMEGVTFWDPFQGNRVRESLEYFQSQADIGRHRAIERFSTEQWGIEFVTIKVS